MKNTRIVALFLMMILGATVVFGQTKKAYMSFKTTEFDFGKIEEVKGPVNITFEFTNTGSEPVIIGKVDATCGCTTPTWSDKPVLPGEKGFVKAVYDPKDRPGKFDKSITVNSNAQNSPMVLRIKGDVLAKPLTVEDVYKKQMGLIRIVKDHVSFGRVFTTDVKTETIDIINTSNDPVTLAFDQVAPHLKIDAVPGTMRGGEKGKIRITYNVATKNDFGFTMDYFYLKQNNKTDYNNRISLDATIDEDFSKLTPEDKAKAPKIKFNEMTFAFGKIKQGAVVNYTFDFVNEGKNDLFIRKTSASCGCTAPVPTKGAIAGGKKGSIQVSFNSAGKMGEQNKTVTVYTNDPTNPFVTLWIKGVVE
jgi:hypothetical protein